MQRQLWVQKCQVSCLEIEPWHTWSSCCTYSQVPLASLWSLIVANCWVNIQDYKVYFVTPATFGTACQIVNAVSGILASPFLSILWHFAFLHSILWILWWTSCYPCFWKLLVQDLLLPWVLRNSSGTLNAGIKCLSRDPFRCSYPPLWRLSASSAPPLDLISRILTWYELMTKRQSSLWSLTCLHSKETHDWINRK